jgi:transcriptional regulator with XRE-family HTH domain
MVSGRKPDLSRWRRAIDLRARGLTLSEIGRRLGLTKQGVSLALKSAVRAKRRAVPCYACGVAIVSAGALPSDAGKALCLSCLDRSPGAPFGQRLKAFRLAAGLAMADLNQWAQLAPGMVWQYEREHRHPSPATRARLAKALRISLAVLEGDAPIPQKPSLAGRGTVRPTATRMSG